MLKLFLWLRYLRKKKIVSLSIGAVAISVSLLIVVASLFTGFINAFERSAIETIGDVVLASGVKFPKYSLFIKHLEQTNAVIAATATLSTPGLLYLGEGNVRAVEIWGIEPGPRARVTGYQKYLLRQKSSLNRPSFDVPDYVRTVEDSDSTKSVGGFVGIGVLAEPDEKTDEYDAGAVEKMISREALLTTGTVIEDNFASSERVDRRFKRRTIKFTISDIVFTGVYDIDKNIVYLPIEELLQQLYPNEQELLADHIQIKLNPDIKSDLALAVIRGVWESFASKELNWEPYLIRQVDIATAKQMQGRYVAELRKQMGVLLLIFGIISVSVIILIFCIFYMIVRIKQKDIAIIKSCGAASTMVAWIFVGFGICVGVFGSIIGGFVGYFVTRNINVIEKWVRIIFGLKLWRSSVYIFSRIPNEVDWNMALGIMLLAIIAAALGALVPAIVAARTKPVEILRYE